MATPKLRFKEFDGDWKIKKLGNCFNLISGYAFPSSASVDKGAKWLKIADVGIQEMTPSSLSYLPHEFLEKYPQFIVSKEDYVIALTRPILNKKLKIAKVGSSYDGALLNQRVAKIQTNENDLGFIYSLLQKSKTVEELENSISGTDPPNLSLNDVKDIRLGFPSIEEQTKIATFLSAVDEKISQLTQKHELLSQYKQGMMQKLFSQQIRFKADDGSEFGEWEETTLGQTGKFIGGGTPSKESSEFWEGSLPWISSSDLTEESIFKINITRFISQNALNQSATKLVPANSILIVSRVGVGKVAITPNEICTSQDFTSLTLHKGSSIFFAYLIKSLTPYLLEMNQGTSIKGFVKEDLSNLEISIPCLEEQTKIANFLSAIDQKIEVAAQQIEQAKQWKKGLLQQMFV